MSKVTMTLEGLGWVKLNIPKGWGLEEAWEHRTVGVETADSDTAWVFLEAETGTMHWLTDFEGETSDIKRESWRWGARDIEERRKWYSGWSGWGGKGAKISNKNCSSSPYERRTLMEPVPPPFISTTLKKCFGEDWFDKKKGERA